jgi:hypothetical protein
VLCSLCIVAALFTLSTAPPAVARPCEFCTTEASTGIILANHNPNQFITHTATDCDQTVPAGSCGWDERMLILKYSPVIRDWVKVTDKTVHVFGQCGNGVINYHTETYPVGTGRFRAELDVKNQYGTVIDSYTYELVF